MCSSVTNNLFPCDSKPTSFVATGALVVAVASAILLGTALYLQWGIAAIGSLAATATLATLVALAIMICKKPTAQVHTSTFEEAVSALESAHDNFAERDALRKVAQQLYVFIKKGEIDHFTQAINSLDQKVVAEVLGSVIFLDTDDVLTWLVAEGPHPLFKVIVMLKDENKKVTFLNAALMNAEEGKVQIQWEDISEFLEIRDMSLLLLLLSKIAFPQEILLKEIVAFPSLTASQKEKLIGEIALIKRQRIDELEIGKIGEYNIQGSILFLAVAYGDLELVRIYAKNVLLINKPAVIQTKYGARNLTPLQLAVLNGNCEIVKILLEAKAFPDFLLTNEFPFPDIFFHARKNSTQYSLLMIAAMMKREDIIKALLHAGALTSTKDHPSDPDAWDYNDYWPAAARR